MPGLQDMPAEALLTLKKVRYFRQKMADGNYAYVVDGRLDLSAQSLKKLPDLSHVIVKGDFVCSKNDLLTLIGAPRVVEGSFYCTGNPRLDSLRTLTTDIKGKIFTDHGNFPSLELMRKERPEIFKEEGKAAEKGESLATKFSRFLSS